MEWLRRSLKARIVDPIKAQMSSGITSDKLALSFAVGIACGLFPVPGTTMIVCGLVTVALKVNPVIPQVLNLVLTPVEVMCIPLFVRLGGFFLQSQEVLHFSIPELLRGLKSDFFKTIGTFQVALFRAVIGWMFWVGPMMGILYLLFRPIMRRSTAAYRDTKRIV